MGIAPIMNVDSPYVPGPYYIFPQGNTGRSFLHKWLGRIHLGLCRAEKEMRSLSSMCTLCPKLL